MGSSSPGGFSPEHNAPTKRYFATMKTFTIQLEDEQQYRQLLQLAAQAGIEVIGDTLAVPPMRPLPDVSHLTREEMLAIIRRGGDGKSISDPLAWQREEHDWDARLAFPKP